MDTLFVNNPLISDDLLLQAEDRLDTEYTTLFCIKDDLEEKIVKVNDLQWKNNLIVEYNQYLRYGTPTSFPITAEQYQDAVRDIKKYLEYWVPGCTGVNH